MALAIDDAVSAAFGEIRQRHARFLIMKCDGERVVVEHKGERGASFDDFKGLMPQD